MIVFKLRMVSDENDHFVRDYEVDAEIKLNELHSFLIKTLVYEECMSSFFSADERWEKLCEYTLIDMGEAQTQAMEQARLCDVILNIEDKLIYQFDQLAARAYFITLMDVVRSEGEAYPREIFAHGTPPDQYDPEVENNDNSIFEDMLGDYGSFDGDDEYDECEW